MNSRTRKWILIAGLIVAVGLAWMMKTRIHGAGESAQQGGGLRSIPVEVAEIKHGPIELHRTFSGALKSTAEFIVAPKVSGRVAFLAVDLADSVKRGQVAARLDNDEYVQAVAQAQADLAVAAANRSEAKSALFIADRELARIQSLRERGVASESKLDSARSGQSAAKAALVVAGAQVAKAEASLETSRIRLGYTEVTADWTGGDDQRIVAERFVDEGNMVAANSPLMSIVELDPITGVIFVTEKDYASLIPGQPVTLFTDAFADMPFAGRISRISPVFKEATRQARVELTIENSDHRLKPGMFIRAEVVIDRAADAVIVPETALTTRDDRTGVFVVNTDNKTVSWREVKKGIREGDRLQVDGVDPTGLVVTLGQQYLDNGSAISIPGKEFPDASVPWRRK